MNNFMFEKTKYEVNHIKKIINFVINATVNSKEIIINNGENILSNGNAEKELLNKNTKEVARSCLKIKGLLLETESIMGDNKYTNVILIIDEEVKKIEQKLFEIKNAVSESTFESLIDTIISQVNIDLRERIDKLKLVYGLKVENIEEKENNSKK